MSLPVSRILFGVNGTNEAPARGRTLAETAEAAPVPLALVAVTVKRYEVWFERPVTLQERPAVVQVLPPAVDVTLNEVTGLPPSSAGAVQLTIAAESRPTPVTAMGCPGTVTASTTIAEDGSEGALVPMPFVAVTVNLYVPAARPVTWQVVAAAPFAWHVLPSGAEVTVNFWMADPPLAGTAQVTVTKPLPATPETFVGLAGTVVPEADVEGLLDLRRGVPVGITRLVGIDLAGAGADEADDARPRSSRRRVALASTLKAMPTGEDELRSRGIGRTPDDGRGGGGAGEGEIGVPFVIEKLAGTKVMA